MSEPLFEPAPDRAELLFADRTAEPPIEVYQQGDIRWLGFGTRAAQSAMSLARPDALVLSYSRAMLLSLLFMPRPRRVLNLGLGGGSIHRFFAAHLPEVSITSVERDPRILEVAGRWFGLDATRTCHVDNAGNWLAQMQQRQDIMICDIQSDGDGLPEEFHDPEFWRHCHSGLAADGVMAINTLSLNEADMVHMLRAAWEAFTTLALVEVPDHRNVVVLAIRVAAPQSLLVERAGALRDRWGIDLSPFIETLRILDRGGMSPVTGDGADTR